MGGFEMSEMKRAYESTAAGINAFREGIKATNRADAYRVMSEILQKDALETINNAVDEILDALCLDPSHDADIWAALLDTSTPVDDMVARLFDLKAGVR
jgi:hypothetical protein